MSIISDVEQWVSHLEENKEKNGVGSQANEGRSPPFEYEFDAFFS
jgi:hypothetical protein